MSTRLRVTIESGALLVLGTIGLWGGLSSYLNADARTQSSWLKPGVFASVLSVGLLVTALAYFYLGFRAAPPRPRQISVQPHAAWSGGIVLVVFAIVALYAFLIPVVGYLPATLLFLLAQFRVLGVGSWLINVSLTVAVAAAFHVVFIRYGGLEFPRGALLG